MYIRKVVDVPTRGPEGAEGGCAPLHCMLPPARNVETYEEVSLVPRLKCT